MIILTNCLAGHDDEGNLKVAAKLIAGLKKRNPEVMLVTYENEAFMSDCHIQLNKLMLSGRLAHLLHTRQDELFFVPQYARMLQMSVKIFILSLYARKKIKVLFPMQPKPNRFGNLLLKLSGAEIIMLSGKSFDNMSRIFKDRVHRIKAAVDTSSFVPAAVDKKQQLREKFGLPVDKPVILHVGHMKYKRNVDKLLSVDEKYHVVLAVSTTTAAFKDADLEEKLREKANITVIDSYIPHIEELYQASDLYLFPVVAERACIDVPLSAFEAAACNLPVLATPYGELQEMLGKEGFYPIESFEPAELNAAIENALACTADVRKNILGYDWEEGVDALLKLFDQENPRRKE